MLQIKTILYATDFSPISEALLPFASALARQAKARLLIAHVEEPTIYREPELAHAFPDVRAKEQKHKLKRTVPGDPGVYYEHRLLRGAPALALLELAERDGADLIVMGTHGRRGLTKALTGSVTETVIRNAECPVLVFKLPHEEPLDVETRSGD